MGYGGDIDVPSQQLYATDTSFVGTLAGEYSELEELISLVEDGVIKIELSVHELDAVNQVVEPYNTAKSTVGP